MTSDLRTCTQCGGKFWGSGRPGRPAARCETCRASRRSDDTAWRTMRARVLREEPVCAVAGCNRPSTTVDHIIPLSLGGPRVLRSNLQGMCASHNFAKGNRLGAGRDRVAPAPSSSRHVCGCGDPGCPRVWHL